MIWRSLVALVRKFVKPPACVECGQTDSTVQFTSGLCSSYVCRICILRCDYDFYIPSLQEEL